LEGAGEKRRGGEGKGKGDKRGEESGRDKRRGVPYRHFFFHFKP